MIHPSAALLVVSRFRVPPGERAEFLAAMAQAMDVLGAQPGCVAASLGQSTDDADLLLLRSEWDGVGSYRRALSSYEVKVQAIPLLSRAIDEPSAFEVVRHVSDGVVIEATSGLAADAGEVRLGSAAGTDVRPVSS